MHSLWLYGIVAPDSKWYGVTRGKAVERVPRALKLIPSREALALPDLASRVALGSFICPVTMVGGKHVTCLLIVI